MKTVGRVLNLPSPTTLLAADENEFREALKDAGIQESNIVSFTDAKRHMDRSVAESRGYHSQAVQEIFDDVRKILPEIETVNLADKLSEYQQRLDSDDGSNGADQETLKAVLAIAEVLNDPLVSERVSIDGEFLHGKYNTFLPQVLELFINDNLNSEVADDLATTDDVAEILYQFSEKLVDASDKLGDSFEDRTYVAMYDQEDESFWLNYEQAQAVRFTALLAANQLSTYAAYQLGSDEFYRTQSEDVEIDVFLNNSDEDGTVGTLKVQAEYNTSSADPVAVVANQSFLRHRQNPKYLNLARTALQQAGQVASLVEIDESDADQKVFKDVIDNLNAHLTAQDGEQTPFIIQDEGVPLKLNLQAFYSLDNGLDSSDYTLTNNRIECQFSGDVYYAEGSKVLNAPACHSEDHDSGLREWLTCIDDTCYQLDGYIGRHIVEMNFNQEEFNKVVVAYSNDDGQDVEFTLPDPIIIR